MQFSSQLQKRRIVIIGGVAAGPAAAAKAAKADPLADVILYEKGNEISYGVCELPYFLSGEINNYNTLLIYTPEKLWEEKRVKAMTEHTVQRIYPAQRYLEIRNDKTELVFSQPYDKLIIATGSRLKRVTAIPSLVENVFYLKTLHDTRKIADYLSRQTVRSVCVIGAGFVGVEMVEVLLNRGLQVSLAYDTALPLPHLESEGQVLIERILQSKKTLLFPSMKKLSCGIHKNIVTKVMCDSHEIEADLFLIAIGNLPNTDLAANAGIRVGRFGGILTDQMQMTNIDQIYAAGDCTEVLDLTIRKTRLMQFASLANRTARIAGENAAGGSRFFKGSVPVSALHVFGYEIAQVGNTVSLLKEAGYYPVKESIVGGTRVEFMPDSKSLLVTLVADTTTRRILAATIIGKEQAAQRANTIALAIRQELTVDEFLHTDFIYTPRLAPLRDPLLLCAQKLVDRLNKR